MQHCGHLTPPPDPLARLATTPVVTTTQQEVKSIGLVTASGYLDEQICLTERMTFTAPDNMVFFVEDSFYGVNKKTNNKCEPVR